MGNDRIPSIYLLRYFENNYNGFASIYKACIKINLLDVNLNY